MLITPKRLADAKEAYAALAEFIVEAEAQQPAPEPTFPDVGEIYRWVSSDGDALRETWAGDRVDLARLARGNVHRTEADARAWDANNVLMAAIEKDAAADRAANLRGDYGYQMSLVGNVHGFFTPRFDVPVFHTREAAEASAKRHGVGVET